MKARLQDDLKAAMKARETNRLMTIRGILTEITRLEKDLRREPNEGEIAQIIKRERARREEALGFARQANRDDLVTQYEAEARVLDAYIPQGAGADEIQAAIGRQMEAGLTQMGPLMKALKDEFGARLDGKTASELVKEALGKR